MRHKGKAYVRLVLSGLQPADSTAHYDNQGIESHGDEVLTCIASDRQIKKPDKFQKIQGGCWRIGGEQRGK